MATILHIAETFSGGTASAICDYARSTPQHRHLVLGSNPRGGVVDAIDETIDEFILGPRTTNAIHWVRAVRNAIRTRRPAIVHAHSSFAGAFVRIAAPRGTRIVYTPHCFAFERLDISRSRRRAFHIAERLLSLRKATFAACSAREADLALRTSMRKSRVIWVPNTCHDLVPFAASRHITPVVSRAKSSTVVMNGRLTAQKDPDFFVEVVSLLRASGREIAPIWIGDGDVRYRTRLERANISVTGWIPRAATLGILSKADIYVHSAQWEGDPLTVIEAAMIGTPIVVRAIPCFERSGLLTAGTPSTAARMTLKVLDGTLDATSDEFVENHSPKAQASALNSIYAPVPNAQDQVQAPPCYTGSCSK